MLGNSIDGLTKLERKRKMLTLEFEQASGYKKIQAWGRLKRLPRVFWDSSRGTYRKVENDNR